MKHHYLFVFVLLFLSTSCSKESNTENENSYSNVGVEFSQFINYNGKSYEIVYTEGADGEWLAKSPIPEELLETDKLSELAMVVDGNEIFLFENEQSKFDYFNGNFEKLIASRSHNLKINKNLTSKEYSSYANEPEIPFNISNFNTHVYLFENINYDNNRLIINNLNQLRDLNSLNFNDKIGSLRIFQKFVRPVGSNAYPHHRRQIIFYEHPNFGGRSIEFYDNYKLPSPYQLYFGHKRLKSLKYGFFNQSNWNDKISSVDVIQNNTSLIR